MPLNVHMIFSKIPAYLIDSENVGSTWISLLQTQEKFELFICVTENAKNLQFVEVEAASVPTVLPDVDIAVINTNYAMQIELSPMKDALFMEDSTSPYVNIVVVREGDDQRPEIQTLMKHLKSEAVKNFINEKYKGAIVPAF